ncbi:glycosyltransferase [Kushneria phosphatilytica]|uniref:Glycosyltransferase n=1 Tax=Kushneria phosphatilytica TaxID=657387 RepID=A0A1S1NWP6_9GAMM|nr:glycosyltransferase [Kushneria phosphatilytica]OHV11992.1 hypothetical protein BH688_04790 [Kushneria phosphatilytica]QEL11178.1 glycosyltransferase [Kushneria phosphatilytica]
MTQRIVLVVRTLRVGGIERVTVNLANTLNRLGHEVHVLVLKGGRELVPDPGVVVHEQDFDKAFRRTGVGLFYDLITRLVFKPLIKESGFIWRGWYGGHYLKRFIARLEHQYGQVDRIIIRGQGAYETVWSWRDPRLWQVSVAWPGSTNGGLRRRWLLRHLFEDKQIICNSSGVMNRLQMLLTHHGIHPKRWARIMNPCDIEAIREMADAPVELPERPFIVHVARLSKVKRQALLIRAYHAANIAEDLVIVGDGPLLESLKALITELGLEQRVHLVGHQLNPYPWMKHARLFVLSSSSEGLGMVLVESLICGTPCTAINAPGGIADVLVEDQARLLTDDTTEALAEGIREGLRHPPEIRSEWIERFRDTRIATAFLELPTHDESTTPS